jgi:hypothetical protein
VQKDKMPGNLRRIAVDYFKKNPLTSQRREQYQPDFKLRALYLFRIIPG